MIANAPQLPVLTPASTNPANEIAKKLIGRDYVSWSAISTFRTCPLKYKFRYVDGLPEESVSSALVWRAFRGRVLGVEEEVKGLLIPGSAVRVHPGVLGAWRRPRATGRDDAICNTGFA